jgi:hypothetical protein
MSALFFVLLISMWTGAGFFIFVKLLFRPVYRKKVHFMRFSFFLPSTGILWNFLFHGLHVVCGLFFSAAFGFALETLLRSRLASPRRESAREMSLFITC